MRTDKARPTTPILLVGDDDDGVSKLTRALVDFAAAWAPATATSLLPALELVAEVPFELIIIDAPAAEDRGQLFLRLLDKLASPPHVVVVDATSVALRRATSRLRGVHVHHASVARSRQPLADVVRGITDPSAARRSRFGDVDAADLPFDPSHVMWVKASGDYVRVQLRDRPSQLVRIPISGLEARWRHAGFIRIHRAYLVSASAVVATRNTPHGTFVTMPGGVDLPVSRRRRTTLRSQLERHSSVGVSC